MRMWNLGYPRMGKGRELKKALESYWAKKSDVNELLSVARTLCATRWGQQHALGVESVPLNDFSFYDHVLDMAFLLGLVPKRFKNLQRGHWLDLYFAMARGWKEKKKSIHPLEMTKWFNSNYHYLVPEIDRDQKLALKMDKLEFECEYARSYPYIFHPVIQGPWTLVTHSQLRGLDVKEALSRLVPLYKEILSELKHRNFTFVQVDEPALCLDTSIDKIKLVAETYDKLAAVGIGLRLTTYFESPAPWLDHISEFSLEGVHFDLVYGKKTIKWLESGSFPKDKSLSVGIVDGRNIWATSLKEQLDLIDKLGTVYHDSKVWIAPSCSLLHLPIDKNLEKKWDEELLAQVAFADQRLEELSLLKKAHRGDIVAKSSIDIQTLSNREKTSRVSPSQRNADMAKVESSNRPPFAERRKKQAENLLLPLLPTSTIGSFPQTPEVREARRDYKKGILSESDYEGFFESEIERVIRLQEEIGLDVLVHGECERSDMVEYFSQYLDGFIFSSHGWVQSYGNLCVRPPILYGDVKRKSPMTVRWFSFAQSLSERPVKAILTGPVTLMNWSFVRTDQERKLTALQIAMALREEVADLEQAGAKIIQIDEAAFREAMPLLQEDWESYLKWATEVFRVSCSGVGEKTQIHTHMCYSEFDDIAQALEWLDADVLLIEFIRSGSKADECFKKHPYNRDIGPGIYDIHSAIIPSEEEFKQRIERLLELFPAERLWINPDCGLKTRKYEEIIPSLKALVASVKKVREGL